MVKKISKYLLNLTTFNYLSILLIILTIYIRFSGLGYSHFYGDETKTFYLDKTISAVDFFLQQRKGPGQFFVVWVMEKIFGNYDEFIFRIPFAIAGTLSVLGFYFLVSKFYISNKWGALFSTFLFSISGFFVAFSRTIQYQSFVILLGILGIYLWKSKRIVLSSIFFSVALLFHYDSIFFLIPVLIEIIRKFKENKKIVLTFLIILISITSLFYIPYILKGNFISDTFQYLSKRQSGFQYLPSSSLLTFIIYNPNILFVFALLIGFYPLYKIKKTDDILIELYLWFSIPYFVFELIFSNPGTHIYNYILPLIILSGVGFSRFPLNNIVKIVTLIFVVGIAYTNLKVYVPDLNNGYPWNTYIFKDKYQLFLYGFPYNRKWDEVSDFILKQKNKENFYTNDNLVFSSYYLYPMPTYSYNPKYYILVDQSQEFKFADEKILDVFDYRKVKTIEVEKNLYINIFERSERKSKN